MTNHLDFFNVVRIAGSNVVAIVHGSDIHVKPGASIYAVVNTGRVWVLDDDKVYSPPTNDHLCHSTHVFRHRARSDVPAKPSKMVFHELLRLRVIVEHTLLWVRVVNLWTDKVVHLIIAAERKPVTALAVELVTDALGELVQRVVGILLVIFFLL